MPSLWRNGIRLGDIVAHGTFTGDPGAISGRVQPTPAFTDIEPMMQSRMSMLPGSPTFQAVIDRIDPDTKRGSGNNPTHKKTRTALMPLSEEEARGVAPEKLLEIRDDDGRILQFDFMVLYCFVIPPHELEEAEKVLGPGIREMWEVSANSPTTHER